MGSGRLPNNNIDLGLSVLCSLMRSGDSLSHRDIAEVCGCTHQYINNIEINAMAKLREETKGLDLL